MKKNKKKIITIKVYSTFTKGGESFKMIVKGDLTPFAKKCIVNRMIEDYPRNKIMDPINYLIERIFQ